MTTTQIGELTIDDIVRPGFALDPRGRAASCNGINHRDSGQLGACTGCNAEVVRREGGGVFPLLRYATESGRERAVFACYQRAHECDPIWVERQRSHVLRDLARGVPVIGAPARVVRGRKVPQGTEGTVVWAGEGDFGPRVGLRDAAGYVHWTAAGNIQVVPGPALLAEIETQVTADRAAAEAKRVERDEQAHRESQRIVLRAFLRNGQSLVGRRVQVFAYVSGKAVGEGEIIAQHTDGHDFGFEIQESGRENTTWRNLNDYGTAWKLLD